MSGEYTQGRFLAKLLDFGPYSQPRKNGGDPVKKFGMRFEFCDKNWPKENNKTILFDSFVDTDAQKDRVMRGLLGVKYDPNAANKNPMAQKARLIGNVARIFVVQDDNGYWGVKYVDDPDAPDARGDFNPIEKSPMSERDAEDFATSFVAFAQTKAADGGAPAPAAPAPQTQRRVASTQTQRASSADEFAGASGDDSDIPF